MKVHFRKELDGAWRGWLKENLDRKCDPSELMQILQKNGFDMESIRENMGPSFPDDALFDLPRPDYWSIANARITHTETSGAVRVPSNKIQLYTLENFLSAAECDQIIDLTANRLRRSTVTTGDAQYRTSSTCDLSLIEHPDIVALDEKIARTLGISRAYSEGIQAQRYDEGQEFRQHTDYFQPNSAEYAEFAGRAGQRTWTFMVYLNEGMEGGGTHFYKLNKVFMPKKGMAVIWNNLTAYGEPNPHTLHAGLPIESGFKIIITKWFRDRGQGEMLL